MNSQNSLGSHLFILNLNFNKLPDNSLERKYKEINFGNTKNKNVHQQEIYNSMKQRKRKISIVEEFSLPEINEHDLIYDYKIPNMKSSNIFDL